MHTLLVILAMHGVILGFAFLIAGYITLLMGDESDEAEVKRGYEDARKRGWVEVLRWHSRFRRNFTSASRLASNWKSRPDARKFIYVGLGFLAFAALLGIPLGAYR
jgi:hypothetical protein